MPDQPEQQANRFRQPTNQGGPWGKLPPPAASEVFGPFGPSDLPLSESFGPFYEPPVADPALSMPSAPPISSMRPIPQAIYFPPTVPDPPVAQRRPIYFPLTRGAPVLLQIFDMLSYSLVLAISIMSIALYLFNPSHPGLNIFSNVNGSTNGVAVLLAIVLVLLIVPACSLLSGAFFGSWRGLLVSLLSIGGGILLVLLSNPQFWSSATSQLSLELAPLPISALVVGLIYDRRRYASWGKSLSILLLGSSIICVGLSVFLLAFAANSPGLASAADSVSLTPQNLQADLGILLGFVAILGIPLLAIPMAAIEGFVHSRIAALKS